ncbi:hypothetical protein [Pacificibacter sp. AS14]|uniref:hypothetical protein n=1 Tax=Pacificibacter sp. AS14 TaxID=3135785 RepID=UPI003181E7D5
MIRVFVFFVLSVTFLNGCVSTDDQASPPTTTMEALAHDLQILGVKPRFIALLAKEGAQAGVRSFRPLPKIYNVGRTAGKARLYGLTKRNGVVYLDTETDAGRTPFIILHEISHAAHYGGACGGHNSPWADDFAARAARFQAQFPNARWLGQPPVQMARDLARQYGVGSHKCP